MSRMPGQEPLDADPRLGPGQRPAGAGVRARGRRRGARGRSRRSTRNSVGFSKRRGSRLAAPLSTMTVVPAGMSTPPTVVGPPGQPEVALDRALHAQALLDEVRDALAVARSSCCRSGFSPIIWNAVASSRTVVSWPAEKRLAATRTTSMTSGMEPSGKVAVASAGEHVRRGLAPPVLDVGRETVVEELERASGLAALAGAAEPPWRPVPTLQLLAERLVVGLGHAEQVGDDVQGERPGEVLDELALAPSPRTRRSGGRPAAT